MSLRDFEERSEGDTPTNVIYLSAGDFLDDLTHRYPEEDIIDRAFQVHSDVGALFDDTQEHPVVTERGLEMLENGSPPTRNYRTRTVTSLAQHEHDQVASVLAENGGDATGSKIPARSSKDHRPSEHRPSSKGAGLRRPHPHHRYGFTSLRD